MSVAALLATDANIVDILSTSKEKVDNLKNNIMAKNVYSERFLSIVDKIGLSDAKIANSVEGLDKTLMSHIRTGRQGASINVLSSLCEAYPQVNANYILTGKGNMFLNNEEKMESSTDIGAIGLTYDELARFYETTVSRYERLIEDMKIKFEALENAFRDAKETFDGRESA